MTVPLPQRAVRRLLTYPGTIKEFSCENLDKQAQTEGDDEEQHLPDWTKIPGPIDDGATLHLVGVPLAPVALRYTDGDGHRTRAFRIFTLFFPSLFGHLCRRLKVPVLDG